MNDLGRFFQTLSQARAKTLVVQAYCALKAFLALIDARWQISLLAHLDRHPEELQAALHANAAFASVLRQMYEAYEDDLLRDDLLSDPTALVDFSTLIAFLAEDYPAALPEPVR